MFDISTLKAVFAKYGLSKPSSYLVTITPPSSLNDSFISDLPLLIDTAEIPELGFITEDIKAGGFGVTEKRVTNSTNGEFTVTIIGDASGKVLSFLESWMALTHNSNPLSGTNDYGVRPNTSNYPVNYWGTVELHVYDITSKKFWTHTLHRAFPLTRGSVQLGWEQLDSLVKIPVTFSFSVATNTRIDSISNQSSSTNDITSTNNRNLEKIQTMIVKPDVSEYSQRLTEV